MSGYGRPEYQVTLPIHETNGRRLNQERRHRVRLRGVDRRYLEYSFPKKSPQEKYYPFSETGDIFSR